MTKLAKLLTIVFVFVLIFTAAPRAPRVVHAQDTELYTYKLTQSTAEYQFWTTPPSERVFKDSAVPTDTGAEVKVYAARNEFEPFQVIVQPSVTGGGAVSIGDFGAGITTEIYQVKYVYIAQATDSLGRTGDYPDPLWPIENGAVVSLPAQENTAFWFSVFVPETTPAGDYTANVQIGAVAIPVRLHVFDFAIPAELHVKSQMNFSHENVLTKYSVPGHDAEYWMYVDGMKQYFIDHRLTSKSPLWPGGLTSGGAPFINYDCDTRTFSDPHGIWGFEHPANKYLNGADFNDGMGFPSFMAVTFRNNDASADQRPNDFCGQTRSAADWYTAANPDTLYNQQWFSYTNAIQDYLSGLGYLDKAYYYFANEPQDQADYDAVAWYSQELKRAAPHLKLMVSEEPRAEIYAHPTHTGAKIDIWLPVLHNYDPEISHQRALNNGEETWIYFLHGTRSPYFNPITLDHPGIESKLTGWFLWKYRVRGIAYYSLNNWDKNPWTDPMTDGHNGDWFMLYPPSETNEAIAYGANNHRFVPSIRFELMRDSLEDYEYLYLLAGGQPQVGQVNGADAQADKIISGVTGYTRNSEFMYNLRRLIGQRVGGEIAEIPDIQPPATHPRAEGAPGNYYINFQDPAGEPSANPLIVNGHEYMKIGWSDYDAGLGYGWYSRPDAHWMGTYLSSGPNELQRSVIYSDWGRAATFEFDLPAGTYNITVSVGWQDKVYNYNYIDVEGVNFVNVEASNPYIVRTRQVYIADNKLTMAMGDGSEYTMLNYMDIEAVQPPDTPTPTTTATATETSDASPTTTATSTTTPSATETSEATSTATASVTSEASPTATATATATPTATPTTAPDFCPALPAPTGNTVNVSNVTELVNAVNSLAPNTTILLADGTYNLNGEYLWIRAAGATLRSASGDRAAVILDGNYQTTEIVTIAASDVTVADLTIQRARTHPIHVMPDFVNVGHVENALIYNVHIIDPGQQAIKINPSGEYYVDNGVVACSRIELTDAGRPHIWNINGSCYTGGVDAHQAWGWEIRDNYIEGFWCEDGLSEHAVHFWVSCRDTVVERNIMVNNARGVGFGLLETGSGRIYDDNPCPDAVGYVEHYDGVIRNNFIFADRAELFSSECGFDCGVCLAQACGAEVLHNTVASTNAPFSSIEWRFDNTSANIINNLVSHNLRERGGTATLGGNLENASLSLFVDSSSGDLHLAASASAAIDQGETLDAGLCDADIDGEARSSGAARDIGADEYVAPAPVETATPSATATVTATPSAWVYLPLIMKH